MKKGTLLLVDGNKSLLKELELLFRDEFEKVLSVDDPGRIDEMLRKNDVDIVVLDMNYKAGVHNGNEGLFWMREVFKTRQLI